MKKVLISLGLIVGVISAAGKVPAGPCLQAGDEFCD